MTIFVASPFGDKKPENSGPPLVSVTSTSALNDLHNQNEKFFQSDVPKTILMLSLGRVFILLSLVLCSIYFYHAYEYAKIRRARFHGTCEVPYEADAIDVELMVMMNKKQLNNFNTNMELGDSLNQYPNNLQQESTDEPNDVFFNEEFELDDDEGYEKIVIPNFRDGRQGSFIHDFKRNQTSIVDTNMHRCFIMPLDHLTVLPPKLLWLLIHKMTFGYNDIDTKIMKREYRVITPAVSDMSQISVRIAKECGNMKIYMLEEYVKGESSEQEVSVLSHDGMFAQFSGKHIVYVNILNIAELNEYEESITETIY